MNDELRESLRDIRTFLRYCAKADGLGLKMGAESRCCIIAEAARYFVETAGKGNDIPVQTP